MILLISVSVFLTLSAIVLLVYQLATAQQRQVAARLEQMARGEQAVVAKTSAYQEEEPTGIRRFWGRCPSIPVCCVWKPKLAPHS